MFRPFGSSDARFSPFVGQKASFPTAGWVAFEPPVVEPDPAGLKAVHLPAKCSLFRIRLYHCRDDKCQAPARLFPMKSLVMN